MTTSERPDARRRGGVLSAALGAMRSRRSWRATLHALAGLALGLGAGAALAGVVVVWWAAVWSLVDGPTGAPVLAVVYVVAAVVAPLPLLWCVRGFGAVQRARFRAVLGVEIPAPPGGAGDWPLRPIRSWRAPTTWRQLAYHLLALVIGVAGGTLVAACWSGAAFAVAYAAGAWGGSPRPAVALTLVVLGLALLPAAPWVALSVARADLTAARALLGPSRGEELAERVESLARSRAEVVAATDAERRRIERDLHDGAQQRLVSLAMHLGMARANLADAPEPARQALEQARDEATKALTELRDFVRGLHPAVLDDRGLDAALSGIAARAPLPVRLRVEVPRRCSPSIEAIAYFVVSEALTNVAKHAQASHAEVTVERAGERLRILVSDDGRGGATPADGSGGLRGLAQRAAAVDGTLTVHSPPGGPTTITVELPCES
ncbi:MAG TPA: sensor histidine kinase [Actinomycetes bacterium]